jgi:homoserine kinase type II
MGIKSFVSSRDLPPKFQRYQLYPTTDGVMATVYLLDDIYVLKLFDSNTPDSIIDSEIDLLSKIQNLPIPKVVDRFCIGESSVVIYTQISGKIVATPSYREISQIGTFLKEFHKQSRYIHSTDTQRYGRGELERLIESTSNHTLQRYLNDITLIPQNDGIIHGDLFLDNCKFLDGELSGVYDFSDASIGDFHFELAVVSIDWCFVGDRVDDSRVDILLDSYGSSIDRELFVEYIRYALLYYATTRFVAHRNYMELFRRLDLLL